ncbi:MAG: thioredoxin domain-containing protein [Gammaproteobacteria bacterium]|nr:thioredoxin domain-containing protein [Gammaproteobacteria bacterium]
MTSLNHLAQESSPYLQQHADNPVDWYPWGTAAFNRARQEKKPILLSIGYSACHWCHVMAHESFEDPETAALMNKHFINIKVDREERPDLDKIYQLAHTAITQRSGGWPLTMFLTPDQIPYFGGTYFPDKPRYGIPAFKDILVRVAEYPAENPAAISQQNQSLLDFFDNIEHQGEHDTVNVTSLFKYSVDSLKQGFDPAAGGFGAAPKFPQSSLLELALKLGWQNSDDSLHHIAQYSLQKMINSGLYDQLGGGFFRYSVDAEWMIPHFEKMLYDNGQLLHLMALAWRVQPNAQLERAIDETVQWLQRDMKSTDGSFYSALDADSENQEGKYYVWTPAEIESELEPQAYALIKGCYGLNRGANFEDQWHLHLCRHPSDLATELDLNGHAAGILFDQARRQLLSKRQQRISPRRDNKVLCSWNALTIKGLVTAGLLLDKPDYINIAELAFQDVQKKFRHNGRLNAVHCNGQSRFAAYLDDYAFLLEASLLLLEAKWSNELIEFAQELAAALLEYFYDYEQDIFYFTASDHEQLIHRPYSLMDESTPSGAAVASRSLLALGHLLANQDYIDAATSSIEKMIRLLSHSPLAHGNALLTISRMHYPDAQIILRGEKQFLNQWQQCARSVCSPWTSVYAIESNQTIPGALSEKTARDRCTAYICHAGTCKPAINHFEEFKIALQEISA